MFRFLFSISEKRSMERHDVSSLFLITEYHGLLNAKWWNINVPHQEIPNRYPELTIYVFSEMVLCPLRSVTVLIVFVFFVSSHTDMRKKIHDLILFASMMFVYVIYQWIGFIHLSRYLLQKRPPFITLLFVSLKGWHRMWCLKTDLYRWTGMMRLQDYLESILFVSEHCVSYNCVRYYQTV